MPLRSFPGSLDFTRNEQMGVLEAFRGNADCVKYPRNVMSHISTPRNVSGKNMTRAGEVKNVPRTAKIEGYNTRFRTSRGPRFERHVMSPRDMGGHWKRFM